MSFRILVILILFFPFSCGNSKAPAPVEVAKEAASLPTISYEGLSQQLNGRHIRHTILLHHNLTSAFFLGDLIAIFRERGWDILPAVAAYDDPVYQNQSTNVPAGESLIWAMAKQSGKFESVLRYPAEDEVYEKDKMDLLGL